VFGTVIVQQQESEVGRGIGVWHVRFESFVVLGWIEGVCASGFALGYACIEGAWEYESRLWRGRDCPVCVCGVKSVQAGCILWPQVAVRE
jgi:hypothetical protein